jgi:hypothetical protein
LIALAELSASDESCRLVCGRQVLGRRASGRAVKAKAGALASACGALASRLDQIRLNSAEHRVGLCAIGGLFAVVALGCADGGLPWEGVGVFASGSGLMRFEQAGAEKDVDSLVAELGDGSLERLPGG